MAKFLVGNKVENAGSYRIKFYNSETKGFIHEVEYTGENDKSIKYDLTKLVEDTTDKFKKDVNYFLTISAIPEDDSKYIESPTSGEISFIIENVPENPSESGGETEDENELPEGFQELTLDGQNFIKQEGYLVDKDGVVQQNTNFNTYIINCDSSLISNGSYEGQYFIQTDIKAENKDGYLVCLDNNDEFVCRLNLETGDFKEGENYVGQLFQDQDNPERIHITTFSGTTSDYIETIKFCKAVALPGEPLVGFRFESIPV